MPTKKSLASRTRAQTKQETRDALIGAALGLFAERGFDAPSLDDICERAGFTRGAFYVHFRDRDDLVTAAMQRVGKTFLDALLGTGAASDDDDLDAIAERFVAALASGVYPITRHGSIRPYQLLQACERSPAIRAQYVALVQETIGRLATATKNAQKRKRVRRDVASDGIGLVLVSLVIGVQTLIDLEVPVDIGKSTALILRLLRTS